MKDGEEQDKNGKQLEFSTVSDQEKTEILGGRFISVPQFAERFSYSKAYVDRLLLQGRIPGIKPLGSQWRIALSTVERIAKEGMPPMPKKQPEPRVVKIKVPAETAGKLLDKKPERTNEPGKETKKESKAIWPFSFILGSDEKDKK